MTYNNKPLAVSYSDSKLRILVEEYITQQISDFVFKKVCSFILYWAMEDGKIANVQDSLFNCNDLLFSDQERVRSVLNTIIRDGRIKAIGDGAYHKL